MNFDYVEATQELIKPREMLNERSMCIHDFQRRILDIVYFDETPIMEKINFLKIIKSNIREYISYKLPLIKIHEEYQNNIKAIQTLLVELGEAIDFLNEKYSIPPIEEEIKTELVPVMINPYVNTGDPDSVVIDELEFCIEKRKADSEYSVLSIIEEPYPGVQLYPSLPPVEVNEIIFTPPSVLLLDKYYDIYREKFDDPICYYPEQNISKPGDWKYSDKLLTEDILIRTPFQSFDYVLKFIDEMSTSDEIQSIFITLYRTAKNSKVVKSLINAAKNGKDVFVFVELTARGDEEHNLEVVKELQQHNIKVKVSYIGYKVHCKACCAVGKRFKKYAHIGTGNYNEDTAQQYTDFHLFTANQDITEHVLDLLIVIFQNKIYKYMGKSLIGRFPMIVTAPLEFRPVVLKFIDEEIEKGDKGLILIKCNNLYDYSIINKLYIAAKHGVQIKIICRTCCGINSQQNLIVKSKVGRYLEHDRIYIFGDKYFISSADLMLRNISKRVEIMCAITDSYNKERLICTFRDIWNSNNIHTLNEEGDRIIKHN